MYAGTHSLSRELKAVNNPKEMQIGDVFIQGGFPGHAVVVVDMARDQAGNTVFLLAQSYMPAQNIHILRNPNAPEDTPWYDVEFGETLRTPEWTFLHTDLKRYQ